MSGLKASTADSIRLAKAAIPATSPTGPGFTPAAVRWNVSPSIDSTEAGATPWRGPVTAATVHPSPSCALRIARVRNV